MSLDSLHISWNSLCFVGGCTNVGLFIIICIICVFSGQERALSRRLHCAGHPIPNRSQPASSAVLLYRVDQRLYIEWAKMDLIIAYRTLSAYHGNIEISPHCARNLDNLDDVGVWITTRTAKLRGEKGIRRLQKLVITVIINTTLTSSPTL